MFTQSCFIRKNTPELRKKLEELGYKYNGCDTSYGAPCNLYCSFDSYYELSVTSKPSRYRSIIDCGTNEELFLALAALRDDSDYMQWFICDDNESMFKVDKPDMSMSKFIHEYMDGWDVSGARKATVEEIIEHFKDR